MGGGGTRVAVLAGLGDAAVTLGDRDLARRLHDELLPYRQQMAVVQAVGVGPVAHYLGRMAALLGHPDEADEHFANACDLQERTGARGLLVPTRLEWARLLLQRGEPGDGDRARALAGAAAQLADELDTPALRDRAVEALATSRAV